MLKDRNRNGAFSQQPVDQFTQQVVAQLKAVHFTRILWSQNASLESFILAVFQIHQDAERQLKN